MIPAPPRDFPEKLDGQQRFHHCHLIRRAYPNLNRCHRSLHRFRVGTRRLPRGPSVRYLLFTSLAFYIIFSFIGLNYYSLVARGPLVITQFAWRCR